MKLKKLLAAASTVLELSLVALIILLCLTYVFTGGDERDVRQNLNYTESTEKINNPDQGFYRPISVKVTESGATYNGNIITASTQLYHLRIDISAFSGAANGTADKLLTQEALSGVEGLLALLKTNRKSAVVRFAYDPYYGGKADMEPALQTMLEHIKQVCPVLNKFPLTITAVEAGMVGPWGEMHTSKAATPQNITAILNEFLSGTQELPVLARTPKMIYDYLGITAAEAENYTIPDTAKAYRLGLFNDGYLGSPTDLGTYSNRERDIAFLGKQTAHLPYGGEVVIPNSTLHDIVKCLPEMFRIHLSYLNAEWNNNVIDKWKSTFYTSACGNESLYFGKTAFNYIENRMGYRFLLTDSVFKYPFSNVLKVELTLKNVGFGNLNKAKPAKLLFVNENGETVFTKPVTNFAGETVLNYETDLNLQSGKYTVYLSVFGGEEEGTPLYPVQFANVNMWNDLLKANKIGEIEVAGNK